MSKDYNNGKIYCIRNNITDDIYIGSTCQPLSKRMAKHRENRFSPKNINLKFYQKMNELGVENFYIELVEECPCENNDQFRAREGHFIREMATLNGRIEGRDLKEYYQDNKQYIKEKSNKNYHNNVEARKEQRKEFREQHKEELKQKSKEYRESNKDDINRRRRENIKNYEDARRVKKQKDKDYYEANKEEINRRRREKRKQQKQENI